MAVPLTRMKRPLGQHFTPPDVARMMVSLATAPITAAVLEPCAGEGVFIEVLVAAGYEDITAYEIDPGLVTASSHRMINASFVSADPGRKFSLVVGNPPYIRWRDLPDVQKAELQESTFWRIRFNSLSDYLTFFVAKSVELLEPGGELIFITPSFWMHTMHSETLRAFMLEHGHFETIIHFEEATVFDGVASSIVIFKYVRSADARRPDIHLVRYRGPRRVNLAGKSFNDALQGELFASERIPQFSNGEHWTLADLQTQQTLDAFEAACRRPASAQLPLIETELDVARLGEVADIANGMVSGADAAFRLPADIALTQNELAASLLVAKGADLHPFYVKALSRYIFLPPEITEAELKKCYPNFYRQLMEWRPRLEARYSYGRNLPYWEWAFLRSYNFFRNARHLILVPCKERISHKSYVRFAMAPSGSYPTQDVTALQLRDGMKEDPFYVLALLNSPHTFEWIRHRGLMKGAVAEFSERPLASIPIRLIDWADQREVALHDSIAEETREYVARPDGTDRLVAINALIDEMLSL